MMEDGILQRYWRYGLAIVLVILALIGLRLMLASVPVPEVTEEAGVDVTRTPIIELAAESSTVSEGRAADDDTIQTFDLSNLPIRRDDSIRPALNPNTFRGKLPQHEPFPVYTVQRGDTPIRIAEKFDIQPETLLGGNPQLSEEAGLLFADDELVILPIDGVLHDVGIGETLESIADLYAIPEEEIIAYQPNNLEFPHRVYPDTQILVPGAVREVFQWDPPDLSTVTRGSYWAGQAAPIIVGTGTFVWPTNGYNISQVYWYGHQAVDIAVVVGSPLYASDTGTVTYATWSPYCYANLIVINHGNGFETFYAHLSSFNVVPGQIVYQGNLIGYTGNTGCSTGPHLHFEVRASGTRVNPCAWTSGC